MAEEATASDTTVIGEVIGDGDTPLLAFATLAAGGQSYVRDRGRRMSLLADDGTILEIEVNPRAVAARNTEVRKARWASLATSPLAALFEDVAPGDHVDAELAGWVIAPRARVAVRGQRRERLPDPGDGVGVTATGDVITARRLAVIDGSGADADREARATLDADDREADERAAVLRERAATRAAGPRKPKPPRMTPVPRPWRRTTKVFGVFAAGCGLVALATWHDLAPWIVAGEPPVALCLLAMAFTFAIVAVAMSLTRPRFEAVVSGSADMSSHPTWAIGKASAALIITALLGVPLAGVLGAAMRSGLVPAISFLVIGFSGLGFFLWAFAKHRTSWRLARLLLVGRRLPTPLADGASGRFAGEVVPTSGTPLTRSVTYVQRSRSRTVQVSNKDGSTSYRNETTLWVEARADNSGMASFEVRSGGQTIAIAGAQALWAAPVEYQPVDAKSEHVARSRASVDGGDSIVVLGRLRGEDGGGLGVRAGGPESLVLFAAPGDARRTLQRLTAGWLATAAALLALVAGCIVLGFFLWEVRP